MAADASIVLLSDTLGASMQAIAVDNEAYGNATEALFFGPFFVDGDPQPEVGDSVFGVQDSLITTFEEQPAGTPTPDGRDVGERARAEARFDVVLAPAEE